MSGNENFKNGQNIGIWKFEIPPDFTNIAVEMENQWAALLMGDSLLQIQHKEVFSPEIMKHRLHIGAVTAPFLTLSFRISKVTLFCSSTQGMSIALKRVIFHRTPKNWLLLLAVKKST